MKQRARQAAARLIGRYNLHRNVPVRLDPLEDLFVTRFTDMAQHGMLGAVLTPEHGWPVTPQNRGRILLDYGLSESEARVTMAHEIGHALHHHPGNLAGLTLGLEDKHERQAWEIASRLLIPERVIYEEREAQRIAMVCEVPLFLVELWQY